MKSTNHFYDSLSKIASEIVYCAAGKPYPNTSATTPYRKAGYLADGGGSGVSR